MKDRYQSATKANSIEWTVLKDPEAKTSKAVFYVIEPAYHAHPWTACAVIRTPEVEEISTYAFRLDVSQSEALGRALSMAARWAAGKRPTGKRITLNGG